MKEIETIRAALDKWRKAKTVQESWDAEDEYGDATDQDVMADVLAHVDSQQAEIDRLKSALRYQEARDGRIGTHSTDCYTFGPSHYECALRQIERLKADADQMLATLTLIRNANPRAWQELACEVTEFEMWAKSRANHSILLNATPKEQP